MALYVLDSLLRRHSMVEGYESLIWSERFAAFGDCEILFPSDTNIRSTLRPETWMELDGSRRPMVVLTAEDYTDDEGRKFFKVVGESMENLLKNRVAKDNWTGLETLPNWLITGTPGYTARWIFDKICRDGLLDSADIVPFITPGSLYPASTVAEPIQSFDFEIPPGSVYDRIKELCDTYELGFRLVLETNESKVYFDVYSGNDRTSAQDSVPAVIFSPELDNLENASELTSVAAYKNVAYVYSKNGSKLVESPTATDVSGFNRRAMYVDANDIDLEAGTPLQEALQLRGERELAKQRRIQAFDGEITQTGKYQYEVDYFLGDMVEIRNSDRISKNVRVTEQIFVEDGEGKRSYPTLTDVLLITPGSWFAWNYNQVWEDAPGFWEDA